MILYDSITVKAVTLDRDGDPVPGGPTVVIPAQVDPLTTSESIIAGGSTIITRYKVVTTVDVEAMKPKNGRLDMVWRGRAVYVDGGLERHMLMGRLDHVEFFVIDV